MQDNTQLFEMILDSKNPSSSVTAVPSQKIIPEEWHKSRQEGQLAVDVIETKDDIIVISTMAGTNTENIEVYIHDDLLTIRGERVLPVDQTKVIEHMHAECFWGPFSRTIVLPLDVRGDGARSEYRSGVLIICIPKRTRYRPIPITVIDD